MEREGRGDEDRKVGEGAACRGTVPREAAADAILTGHTGGSKKQ